MTWPLSDHWWPGDLTTDDLTSVRSLMAWPLSGHWRLVVLLSHCQIRSTSVTSKLGVNTCRAKLNKVTSCNADLCTWWWVSWPTNYSWLGFHRYTNTENISYTIYGQMNNNPELRIYWNTGTTRIDSDQILGVVLALFHGSSVWRFLKKGISIQDLEYKQFLNPINIYPKLVDISTVIS